MDAIGFVAASHPGSFIAGLVVGLGIGLLLAPILRSWLAWREWLDASREARLTDAVLERMEQELGRSRRSGAAGNARRAGEHGRDAAVARAARRGGTWPASD